MRTFLLLIIGIYGIRNYEDQEVGLGYDFSAEVFAAIQNIVNYPDAWPVIEKDIRRCLVNRFLLVCSTVLTERDIYTCIDASVQTF